MAYSHDVYVNDQVPYIFIPTFYHHPKKQTVMPKSILNTAIRETPSQIKAREKHEKSIKELMERKEKTKELYKDLFFHIAACKMTIFCAIHQRPV